jgi:ribokinase
MTGNVMASKKIIVVGSYIEALVMDTPRLPVRGETLRGKNFRRTWGGKGSNQAVQASRLGVHTAFVSMIGNDDSGDRILGLMQAEHINTEYVFRHPELPTATGFIICTADGHNIITIDIAALQGLGKSEIDRALAHADAGTAVLVQLEIPLETALYACEKAKSRGATVILNPAPAADLTSFDLSCVDFLTPNEIEARLCLGLPPDHVESHAEVAGKILKAGCSHVIMTLGEEGSLWVNQRDTLLVPAFRLSEVVDSTGAGDAFNAGLAAALAEGRPVQEAVRFGNAAGALACTVADTIPSFHRRAEIEHFIDSN